MSGFNYYGKSTNNIISDCRLIIAAWDPITEVPGGQRETIIGSRTLTRPIANEYGTSYTPVSFSYSLIKEDMTPFSEEEQRTVEKWLTSPRYSDVLELIDCDGTSLRKYKGKFVRTSWLPTHGGYAGVNFTFECVAPYAFISQTVTKEFPDEEAEEEETGLWEIDIPSDETEEYIYPVILIHATEENTVTITNETDGDLQMIITTLPNRTIRIDCDKCLLSDSSISGVVNFDDIGWDDVGNIYWLRLQSGTNVLNVTGEATITLQYDIVDKRAGDWL